MHFISTTSGMFAYTPCHWVGNKRNVHAHMMLSHGSDFKEDGEPMSRAAMEWSWYLSDDSPLVVCFRYYASFVLDQGEEEVYLVSSSIDYSDIESL